MNQRRFGSILVFVGIVAAALGAAADVLGIGTTLGMGYAQIGLMVMGVMLISGGTYLITHKVRAVPPM